MDKYVKSAKEGIEETIDFFGNERKVERELWVLNEFLSYTVSDYDGSGISSAVAEPNDVVYKGIGFQIKEVSTEGRARTREYQDSLSGIIEGTKPQHLLEPYQPIHIPFNDAAPRLLSELHRHRTRKYGGLTSDMNVLVYLNLDDTTFDQTLVDLSLFSEEVSKWNSVSVVTNNCAIMLGRQGDSFPFIDGLVGELKFKPKK